MEKINTYPALQKEIITNLLDVTMTLLQIVTKLDTETHDLPNRSLKEYTNRLEVLRTELRRWRNI
jgi:uncharacterized protein YjgD (DUF1641 family)